MNKQTLILICYMLPQQLTNEFKFCFASQQAGTSTQRGVKIREIANLYIYIDTAIFIYRLTNSSGQQDELGYFCMLQESFYWVRQAGHVRIDTIHKQVITCSFQQLNIEPGVYFLTRENKFLINFIVVHDIAFTSNDPSILSESKQNIRTVLDLKLYGRLKTFIRWVMTRDNDAIFIHQQSYAERLLSCIGLENCNPSKHHCL